MDKNIYLKRSASSALFLIIFFKIHCGSDLHIYQGALPAEKGYVIGHEPMGIVEEVGPEVTKVKKGDRVVLPFNISCGHCFYCQHEMESQCDNSNPNPEIDTGGYFGFTERYGNYPGGQAEYLHVPFGNFMPFVIPGMDGKKSAIEAIEQKLKLQGGTLSAFEIAINAVRKFGTIQLTGVYGSMYNMFPLGTIFERNIRLKMGQAPVIHYMPELFKKITSGEFDPTEIISHKIPLDQASDAYQIFNDHQDECIKVVLKP